MQKYFLNILVLAIISFVSIKATAQTEEEQSGFQFGAKAGVTISTFSNAQPHTGYNMGFTIGGFAIYPLNTELSFQAELNYFQQGGSLLTYKDETRFGAPYNFFTVNQTDSRITLHNIEIPILVRYKLPIADLPVRVYAGPSLAYTLGATDNFERTGYTATSLIVTATGSENVKSSYEAFQVGASAGLGFYIPFGEKTIVIDARYRYGITPARKSYSYITLNNTAEKIRTNTLSFTVGLIF